MPPYPARAGGAVCNIAITRYATATVSSGAGGDPPTSPDDRLVRAALRRSPASDVRVSLASDYPIAAGLGGSSAAGVALAGALAELSGETLDRHALATRSRETEVEELGVPGGYQDHFAAAFGGALLLTFTEHVAVHEITLSPAFRSALVRRGILVYTGESRMSGETVTAVRDAYLAADSHVVNALARMKTLALEMAAMLRVGDLGSLGALMGEHWSHQRALHPSITTPRIEAIAQAAAHSGAIGVKALGASAGGCVLAIADAGREDELAAALAPFGERLDYDIDVEGFTVTESLA